MRLGRPGHYAGALAGLGAAALFGAGTPIAKLLLGQVGPWLLAGLLYTASGLALFGWRLVRRAPRVRLPRRGWLPLAGPSCSAGCSGRCC